MGEARSVPRRGLEARPGARYDLRDVSARGRSRSPMAKFAGSRRERTSPPPSLARFTGGSSLSSSSKYRAGLFAIRARARRSEPSMVPHLRPPVSDRDSSDLLLPSRDENLRARPGAREPTARPPRDHSADEKPTPTASTLRPDADSDTAGVARPRTCEARARCGPLALPETKTQRVRVRRDRPLSRELFREIRARTPRSRDLPRSLPRCSPLGIVKDDSSFDVRRVARACVRRDRHRQRRRVVPHRSGSRQLGCCPTCGGVVAAEFIIRNFRCGSREDLTRERLVETVEAVASNARFLGAPRALPMVSSGWRERSSANSVVHAACVITTTSARRSTTASPPRFYLIRPRRPRCTLER